MSRRALAAAILLVWLGTLAWLVRRELWRPAAQVLAEAVLALPPGATYYTISVGDRQVGYASSMVDTLPDSVRLTDIVLLEFPVLDELQRTEARTEVSLTRDLRLRGFTATVRGEGSRFAVSGRVEGDSVLELTITSGTDREMRRVGLDGPIVLPQLLPVSLALGGELVVGRTHAVRVFDPVQLGSREVRAEVAAESTFVVADSAEFDTATGRFRPVTYDTLRSWRIREVGGTVPMDTWIDGRGQVVVATSAAGFRIERTAFEIAYENFRRRGAAPAAPGDDVIRRTAISAGVSLERTPLASLRIRLGGASLDGFALDGDRQRLRGDTLDVRRERPADLEARYRLPAQQPELRAYLAAEPLVQSDDPRLQAQARQIIGRTRRPGRAAELLERWVHGAVAKQVTVGVPSALEVFATRRGDCNEHTVLYVALARAVGLPARTAAGLAYVDGRFYYHAWPEVYLNGWVAVDPTFGQFPADAAHLRFTVGGLARQLDLLRLVGRLTLSVVATEPGA